MAGRKSAAKEAAIAVNELLHLDDTDQEALLEVIESCTFSEDMESDSEELEDFEERGAPTYSVTIRTSHTPPVHCYYCIICRLAEIRRLAVAAG